MRLLSKLALGLAVGYTGIIALAALYQNELIYMRRSYDSYGLSAYYHRARQEFESRSGRPIVELPYGIPRPSHARSGGAEVASSSPETWQQVAFWIPPPTSSAEKEVRLWIMLGGNAQVALDWLNAALRVTQDESLKEVMDESILLVDFPGYGKSQGVPSTEAIVATVTAAARAAREALPSDRRLRVGVLAHSLGSGAALAFASFHANASEASSSADVYPDRLILGSPFASIPHMAMHLFLPGALELAPPALVEETLVTAQNRWSNLKALEVLARSTRPKPRITVFHGDQDEIVPFKQGELVARTAKALGLRADFVAVPGGDHNSLVESSWRVIRRIMLEDGGDAKL